jgi:hypothetical protein
VRKNTCERDGRCSPPEFRPAGSSATRSMPNALKKPPDELGCPGGGSAIWTLLQRWRSERSFRSLLQAITPGWRYVCQLLLRAEARHLLMLASQQQHTRLK